MRRKRSNKGWNNEDIEQKCLKRIHISGRDYNSTMFEAESEALNPSIEPGEGRSQSAVLGRKSTKNESSFQRAVLVG